MLCIALGASLLLLDTQPVRAVTNDSIQQKEAEIKDAKKEVDKLKSSLTDVEAVKKKLEQSKSDLDAYIMQLDGELTDIQEKIAQYNTMITEKQEQIEVTTEELNEAVRQQEDQYEAMKKRIQFMYEKGDTFYLELLFTSTGFSDMINKADYIEALTRYDRQKLDEYAETTEMVQLCKEQLEAEKEVLDEARLAVEEEEANVSSLLDEKAQQLNAVTSDISNQEEAIKAYEDMIAQQNAEIAALEKAVAEEKARLEAENARTYNGGMFAWPCPGYTRTTTATASIRFWAWSSSTTGWTWRRRAARRFWRLTTETW